MREMRKSQHVIISTGKVCFVTIVIWVISAKKIDKW